MNDPERVRETSSSRGAGQSLTWVDSVVPCKPTEHSWLAIDGAQTQCSLALQLSGSCERYLLSYEKARGHAEVIPKMVDALQALCPFDPRQLSGIACSIGPGAFTGLRISVALAQGLAFGWGLPVKAVSSLAALAYGVAVDVLEPGKIDDLSVLASFDARLGQVYAGGYRFEYLPSLEENDTENRLLHVSCWLEDCVSDPATVIEQIKASDQVPERCSQAVLAGCGSKLLQPHLHTQSFENTQNSDSNWVDTRLTAESVLGLALLDPPFSPLVSAIELLPAYVREAVAEPPARLRETAR